MRRLIVAACVGCVALSSAASAAAVQPGPGKSFLNSGNGYQLLTGPTSAKSGSTVMARLASSATITYDDGCTERVNPGEVVVIKKVSPCKAGTLCDAYAVRAAVVGGIVGGVVLLSNDDKPVSP